MPLPILLALYIITYFLFIMLLAGIFYGIAQVETNSLQPDESFSTCVMCSWQSLTTVGYGTVRLHARRVESMHPVRRAKASAPRLHAFSLRGAQAHASTLA